MANSNDILQTIFNFILEYKTAHDGVPPSRREITKGCQISSTSQTNVFLRQLQDLGLIRFEKKQARTIQVARGKWIYKKNSEEDYQDFLAWYEENETWLECCNGEREALYGAWQAGAGEWYEYDGPEEDED